ncbi:hypothetical protein [Paraburkholderia sp. GAS42]|jgi:hypothetical protein|uniref:hypothetical protein n=1 Tax=Paraburkholderia sp. GAS42 TaxID=3035135 RepID=UPI003D22674C
MTQPAIQALPLVPTARILAIGQFTSAPSLDQLNAHLPLEVPQTIRLYLDGKIAQWYARQDRPGVVFLLDVTSVEEAHALLEELPLGQAGLMTFEFIPLGPLKQLQVLLPNSSSTSGS